MKFLKNLFVSLLLLLLGILTSVLILSEGLKTAILRPTLAYEIVDNFPLQEIAPELIGQYITLSPTSSELPFEFSAEDIEGIIEKILTDDLELYLKTQLKGAITEFYAFMTSETNELNIEISLPDITEKLFEAMPLNQILTDMELPFDICEGGGTDCIDLEGLNPDDLEGMIEKLMSGEQVLGIQNELAPDIESPIPTSVTITTKDLPAEILQLRDPIKIAKYSGWMLGAVIVLLTLLIVALQKWKGLTSVGSTLITTAISFLLLSIFSKTLETFTTDLIKFQMPLEMEGVFNAMSDIMMQASEFLMQQWINYSLIIGGIGIVLAITGMILKKKCNPEDKVSEVSKPESTEVKDATEPKQEKIKTEIQIEKESPINDAKQLSEIPVIEP